MQWLPVDETDDGFGWHENGGLHRTSHALRIDGSVWLIDAVDAPELEERIRRLGEPAGVLQLLDRHNRDGAAWAARLGVPLRHAWRGLAGTPFEDVPVRNHRWWRESAVWEPQTRTLACADALGTLPYFCGRDERIGVHPLLRAFPPFGLLRVEPERVLVGHGGGVHGDATEAVQQALSTARRRAPAAWARALRFTASSWAASR